MSGLRGWVVGLVLVGGAGVAAGQARKMQHPGILVDRDQLAYIRAEVKAKQEPFYGEYQKAVASEYGALDYALQGPPADGVIDCGPYSHPDNGCHAEDRDASAAYLQALLWVVSGDHRYADNAIRIVNAYARGLKSYTGSNQPLQAAWSGENWPRAGELLRYSRSGWKIEDQGAFAQMLTKVILPEIYNGSGGNGNWELSMIDAMMGIAVFTDDRPLLEHAEAMWKERVPAYFYNFELDGPHPLPPPHRAPPRKDNDVNWYGTTNLNASVDGMAQETCRDLGHTGYGIAATTYAAETARIQGDKLFEEDEKRLVPALEFHARLYLRKDPVPKLVCGGKVKPGNGYTFAVGYAEYHDRLGVPLPETKLWLEQVEEQPAPVDIHMMVFEPLTDGRAAPSGK